MLCFCFCFFVLKSCQHFVGAAEDLQRSNQQIKVEMFRIKLKLKLKFKLKLVNTKRKVLAQTTGHIDAFTREVPILLCTRGGTNSHVQVTSKRCKLQVWITS